MRTPNRIGAFLLYFVALLSGCANVHFEHNATSLGDSVLVFGRIVLVRDGEVGHLNALGTQISLQRLDAGTGPRLVTEQYDSDGRFYWKLKPGKYLLNISLNVGRGESADLAFDVPDADRAYYFGDLIISGRKSFGALNAPNIREATLRFEDEFSTEKNELIRLNPGLKADIERLKVDDISEVPGRLKYFERVLDGATLCCAKMSAFAFKRLAIDVSSAADINVRHGVFAFPSGKSAFAAFELPRDDTPYVISIRSEVSDSGVPYRYRIFVPAVTLLDENYMPIATLETGYFRPIPATMLPVRRAALEGNLLIKSAEPRARYLVIYTTPRLLAGGFSSRVPGVIALPAGLIGIAGANLVTMEPWIYGTVHVTLNKPSPK